MSPFRSLRITAAASLLVPVFIGALTGPVAAAGKTYLSLWQRCSATGGAAAMSAEREPILYPFSGEQTGRRYTVCYEGQRGWDSIDRGGAQNYCSSFTLAAYEVSCFGGRVSAPAFFAGFAQQMRANKLTLSGTTLAVEMSPGIMVVPLQQRQMERAMADARRAVPLLAGYAPPPPEGSFRSLAWDEARDIPLFQVTAPAQLPQGFSLPPAPPWVATLAHPVVQILLLAAVFLYAVLAAVGFYAHPPGVRSYLRLLLAAAIAAGAVVMAGDAVNLPARTAEAANARLAQARAQLQAVEADRAKLKSIVHDASGGLAPLTQDALRSINELTRPRTITAPEPPLVDAAFWTLLYLAAPVLFLLAYALNFAAGFYHLFIRPPILNIVRSALRRGKPVDRQAAVAALKPDIAAARNPPPAYQSESDAIHLDRLTAEVERAPVSTTVASGDRQASLLKKIRAATRLMGALVRRRVAQEQSASEPGTSPEDRELEARISEARRRRDEAKRGYEAELAAGDPPLKT